MIIAIDGPAASGKSTTARLVAARLEFGYLDTGAMYRAVAWFMRERELDPEQAGDIDQLLTDFHYRFTSEPGPTGAEADQRHFVNDSNVTTAIRSPAVTDWLGRVTAVPRIREFLVEQQRELATGRDVVLDGRDIGTVVFPDADLKVFLVASLEERARRRALELAERGWPADLDEIRRTLAARDAADSGRVVGPLQRADDAVDLDTTGLTIPDQVDTIVRWVKALEEGSS